MTINFSAKSFLALAVTLAITVLGYSFYVTGTANASAPLGFGATVATTSAVTVTNTASLVFSTTTGNQCNARMISTASSSIMITFSDKKGQRPNAAFGFTQAASTSATYDGSLYGCGAVYIYSFASQQITVMEAQ